MKEHKLLPYWKQQSIDYLRESLIRHMALTKTFSAVDADSNTHEAKEFYIKNSRAIVPSSAERWALNLSKKGEPPPATKAIRRNEAIRIFEKDEANARRLKKGITAKGETIYLKNFIAEEEEKIKQLQQELKNLS